MYKKTNILNSNKKANLKPLKINNWLIYVPKSFTILNACILMGIEVSRFCFHEKLLIAGNCRLCLVHVDKIPKPVVSCSMPVSAIMDNTNIYTDSPQALRAHESVLEFLLLNHPLDCPICDQAGECDLQDQSLSFGTDMSRFYSTKRSVSDLNLGPIIKTIMTRCIHCTRCIRFTTEIAGIYDLGTMGRGTHTEIGTYIQKNILSENTGNIIDLCPVGALTNKPYAFLARPWELTNNKSIDILDNYLPNIQIDSRGANILRILPCKNENKLSEWLSNRTRFSYDGFQNSRVDKPMLRRNSYLIPTTWDYILNYLSKVLKYTHMQNNFGILYGSSVDILTLVALKQFNTKNGNSNIASTKYNFKINIDFYQNFYTNFLISEMKYIDCALLIGSKPQYDSTAIHLALRKNYIYKNLPIYNIGPNLQTQYPVTHLGTKPNIFLNIVSGLNKVSEILFFKKNPILFYGTSVLTRQDTNSFIKLKNIFKSFSDLNKYSSNFNLITSQISLFGSYELGIFPGINSKFNLANQKMFEKFQTLYLVNPESINLHLLTNKYLILQNSHLTKDNIEYLADIILPGHLHLEQESIYINIQGNVEELEQLGILS